MSPLGPVSLVVALATGCGARPATERPAPEAAAPAEIAPAAEPPAASDAAPRSTAPPLFAPIVAADRDWVLRGDGGARLEVQLRRNVVDGVTIARLRWTYHPAGGPPRTDIGSVPVVIAVGPGGVDVHESADDLDDDAVVQLLSDGADLEDPPVHWEGNTSYGGRVVQTARGPIVCFGQEPPAESGFECPDICYAQLCWSAKDGPVRLDGRWAPDDLHFSQPGYEDVVKGGQQAPTTSGDDH